MHFADLKVLMHTFEEKRNTKLLFNNVVRKGSWNAVHLLNFTISALCTHATVHTLF